MAADAGSEALPTRREIVALLLRERRDPDPYYAALARRTAAELDVGLDGDLVLELGSGSGHDGRAIADAGAEVVALDLDDVNAARSARLGLPAVVASGLALPFRDGGFDGVFCSNVLEHVPDPGALLDEIGRVVRPGGWVWLSWTNWWSPWGGHNISPLHLLGPRLGPALWTRLFGRPEKNVPGESLFPTYVGSMLETMRAHPDLRFLSAWPRYYRSQRWLLSVPGLREIATWNCAVRLERR